MKVLTSVVSILFVTSLAQGSPVCPSAPLTTYLNSGAFYACTEAAGNLTVAFNHDALPSYVGLAILPTNNSAALPSAINVVPLNPGLDFESSAFSENSALVSAQTELVHFLLDSGTETITDTTFTLDNVHTGTGTLGLGTGLAVGQELLCVGGTFTSLPTGLVTSVVNGLLGTGAFGCNGVALIGSASASSGPLDAITGILGLSDFMGLTDSVHIQLSPVNQHEVDVIKLQALVTVLGGTASDTGFGNSYTLAPASAAPEPGTTMLMLLAGVLLVGNRGLARLGRIRRDRATKSA